MKRTHKFRLIAGFANGYLLAIHLVNLLTLWFITQFGRSAFNPMFLLLIFVSIIMYGWSEVFRKDEYYYFANLGVGKADLWGFIALVGISMNILALIIGGKLHQLI